MVSKKQHLINETKLRDDVVKVKGVFNNHVGGHRQCRAWVASWPNELATV
jgi:hypothetical protein